MKTQGTIKSLWEKFEELKKESDIPYSEEIKNGDIEGEFQRIKS